MANITKLLADSLRDFKKNPIVAFPTISLLIFFILFSKLSIQINYALRSETTLTLWLIVFSVVMLAATSYFLSGLIGMSKDAIRKKASVRDFLSYSKKFWFRNFVIILITILVYAVVNIIAIYGTLGIGKALELPISTATFVFYLIHFAGLIGIMMFLTFASFSLILHDLSIKKSIKESISVVRKNYLDVLSILVIFFILGQVVNFIGRFDIRLVELVNAIFLVPYFSLVLTRFILKK